jgi:hypothetical protein
MCIGEISNAISRADASPGASALSEQQKPPELGADSNGNDPAATTKALIDAIRREVILTRHRRSMAKLDEMEARLDVLQKKEDARQALLRAEADPETAVARLDPAPPRLAPEDNLPPAHLYWRRLH